MEKYPHIENDYRQRFIQSFIEHYPELVDAEYFITEKIDGTNIRLHFENGVMTVGTRGTVLQEGENHMGLRQTLPKVQPVIDYFIKMSTGVSQTYTLYGELFGPGILKRINYGTEKDIKFFDIAVDGQLCSQQTFLCYFDKLMLYVVPLIGRASSLQAALDSNAEFLTILNPIKDNWAEGIVIKPFRKVYYNGVDDIFYLKKKHPKFKENVKPVGEHNVVQIKDLKPSVLLPYVNDNRILSVFSKHGVISSKKDIKKYIDLVIEEVVEDYLKDSGVFYDDLTQDDLNIGKYIAPILLKLM